MKPDTDDERCDFCNKGKVVKRTEEMAFRQWTVQGYISCKVSIPIGICDRCNAKHWDDAAEAIFEEAVGKACERLLPPEDAN